MATSTDPTTPLERFKTTYILRYRILLILSTLGTAVSLAGIQSLPSSIGQLSNYPVYSLASMLSLIVVLPLAIAALVLLWHKHPTGIRLKLLSYAIGAGLVIISLFTIPPTLIADTATRLAEQMSGQGYILTVQSAEALTELSVYSAFIFTLISYGIFARLWWTAWKKQCKADSKQKNA